MLSKVRAALIITVVWTLCWIPFALGLEQVLVEILVPEPLIDSPYEPVSTWVLWGVLSGLGFAVVLGLGERGHTARHLSVVRVLTWGALGAALPALFFYLYHAVMSPTPAPSFSSLYWRVAFFTVAIGAFLGLMCALAVLALMRASSSR